MTTVQGKASAVLRPGGVTDEVNETVDRSVPGTLRRAKETIERLGWTTGTLLNENKQVCLLGGIAITQGYLGEDDHDDNEFYFAAYEALGVDPAVVYLSEYLRANFDIFEDEGPSYIVLSWNDDIEHDQEEILDMLEAAASHYEQGARK